MIWLFPTKTKHMETYMGNKYFLIFLKPGSVKLLSEAQLQLCKKKKNACIILEKVIIGKRD